MLHLHTYYYLYYMKIFLITGTKTCPSWYPLCMYDSPACTNTEQQHALLNLAALRSCAVSLQVCFCCPCFLVDILNCLDLWLVAAPNRIQR